MRPDVEDRSEHVLPNDRRWRSFLNNAALVRNHQMLHVLGRLVAGRSQSRQLMTAGIEGVSEFCGKSPATDVLRRIHEAAPRIIQT